MKKYHLSTPLFLDDNRIKILCDHILLSITDIGTKSEHVKNIDYFPQDERKEIMKQVREKINAMPEAVIRQYNKK